MVDYLRFIDFFSFATAKEWEATTEVMHLGGITTPLRAAAFLSTVPDLSSVWDHAARWHQHDLNRAAHEGDRTAIAKVFKTKACDTGDVLRRLHLYLRLLNEWQ